MSAAKRKPAKTKGAVLIMVLAVMTVMIILLAGSIAVVYTAHTRAQAEYMNSQEYYTTRSILNTFKNGVLSRLTDPLDSTTYVSKYFYTINRESGTNYGKEKRSDEEKTPLGREINMDLYKVPICTDVTTPKGEESWYKKNILTPHASEADAEKYANVTTADISAADRSGCGNYFDQYMCWSKWTSGMKRGVDDTVTYVLDASQINALANSAATGDNFGRLSDNGSDKAVVKIQVLNRKYNLGSGTTFGEKFKFGSRVNDEMDVRITVEVTHDGQVSTISDFCSNQISNPSGGDGGAGANSFGNIGASTSLRLIGGGANLRPEWNTWQNDPLVAGDYFCNGSIKIAANARINPRPDQKDNSLGEPNIFCVRDIMYFANTLVSDSYSKGATFYFGRLQAASSVNIGSNDRPVNVISQWIPMYRDNDMKLYGNVYAGTIDIGDSSRVVSQRQYVGSAWTNFLGIDKDRATYSIENIGGISTLVVKIDNKTDNVKVGPVFKELHITRGVKIITGNTSVNYGGRRVLNTGTGDFTAGSAESIATYSYQTFQRGLETIDYLKDGDTVKGVPTTLCSSADPATSYKVKIEIDNGAAVTSNVTMDTSKDFCVDYETPSSNPTNYATGWNEGYKIRKDSKGKIYREIRLPAERIQANNGTSAAKPMPDSAKLAGQPASDKRSQFVELPTLHSVYSDDMHVSIKTGTGISFPGDTFLPNGDFNNVFGGTTYNLIRINEPGYNPDNLTKFVKEHTISAECLANNLGNKDTPNYDKTQANEASLPAAPATTLTASDFAGDTKTDTVTGEAITMPAGKLLPSTGLLPLRTDTNNPGPPQMIDARTTPCTYWIKGTNGQEIINDFVVYGHNQVTVYLIGDGVMSLGCNNVPFHFWRSDIAYGSSIVHYNEDDPDRITTDEANATKYPNIMIYVSKNIKELYMKNGNGVHSAISGTLYSPGTIFAVDTGHNGNEKDNYYYRTTRTQIKEEYKNAGNENKSFFYGTLKCSEYSAGQHCGVVVLKKKGESADPDTGGLIFKFKSTYNEYV